MSSSMFGHPTKNHFTIDGVIQGSYTGHLYLHYNSKKDSCLIINFILKVNPLTKLFLVLIFQQKEHLL